ncbi:uncharacterized protein LOC110914420 [Helianthus annuus]|uniref:uncharacterized protein LOC110914420 n=1 Tax=Helianthus annuus TaxID=4232 RepID=UPI000B9030D4|nr:uncharacterized protein LOC110914420 [Helianthus annuus]
MASRMTERPAEKVRGPERVVEKEVDPKKVVEKVVEPEEEKVEVPVEVYEPVPPYPMRLLNKKQIAQYNGFLEMIKKLHVDIPFLEALAKMPKFAKFLKRLLLNKKKIEDLSIITLSEECSAMISNKLPGKMPDLRSFTIPYEIEGYEFRTALADLGASINVMPYSVFKKLKLGEPTPTYMNVQLADHSVKFPRGIVENVLVKAGKFVFSTDFVVLDMGEDPSRHSCVSLILGRLFLSTAKAIIDVHGRPIQFVVS